MRCFTKYFFPFFIGISLVVSHVSEVHAVLGLVAGDISVAPYHSPEDTSPRRSWFMYSAKPGDIIHDSADVTNVRGETKIISVGAVDAGVTGENVFRLKEAEESKKFIGAWVKLEKEEVTLEGGKDTTIPFIVKIPGDAEEGDYWGGITVYQNKDFIPKGNIIPSYRVGARFYIQVKKTATGERRDPRDYPKFNVSSIIGIRDEVSSVQPSANSSSQAPALSSPQQKNDEPPTTPEIKNVIQQVDKKSFSSTILLFGLIIIFFFMATIFISKKKLTKKRIRKSFFILLFAAGILFSFTTRSVFAQIGASPNPEQDGQVTGRSWFVYGEVAPGSVIHDSVRVINSSDQEALAALDAVDGETTKVGGVFGLRNSEEPKKEIGLWTKVESEEVELKPKESKIIPFTISVPKNAEVGDHIGGLVVYKKQKSIPGEGSIGFQVVGRVGVRVYLTVKGEKILSLEAGDIRSEKKDDKYVFTWKLENTGNVRIVPILSLYAENKITGNIIAFELPSASELNPSVSTEIPIVWENPPQGWYNLHFTVEYGEKKLTKNSSLLIVNGSTVLIGASIGLVILLLFVLIVRTFRKPD